MANLYSSATSANFKKSITTLATSVNVIVGSTRPIVGQVWPRSTK